MGATETIRRESVKVFAEKSIAAGATIQADACASYIPALKGYDHPHEKFGVDLFDRLAIAMAASPVVESKG